MKLESKSFGKYKIFFRNEEELDRLLDGIFKNNEYEVKLDKSSPFIVDCGSHIGTSILYFKEKYPNASILGFEPNPENFEILKKNIEVNKLTNIKLVNAALSDKVGSAILEASHKKVAPWTWGDTIMHNIWGDEDDVRKIPIKTVKLSAYLNKKVDLMKLDIEGAEQIVLEEIKDKLGLISNIVMEFHSTETNKKSSDINVVESLLKNSGFKVKTKSEYSPLSFQALRYLPGTHLAIVKASR